MRETRPGYQRKSMDEPAAVDSRGVSGRGREPNILTQCPRVGVSGTQTPLTIESMGIR